MNAVYRIVAAYTTYVNGNNGYGNTGVQILSNQNWSTAVLLKYYIQNNRSLTMNKHA